jgi:hypothetical protein
MIADDYGSPTSFANFVHRPALAVDWHSMKPRLIAACIASLLILPGVSLGQASCRVTVEARVEVARGQFSLADLLSPDTCPAVARAAAEVVLGSAPLAGSVRLLAGSEVRDRLEKLAGIMQNSAAGPRTTTMTMLVPERVSIRRAGVRASCADIGARLLSPSGTLLGTAGPANPAKSAAGKIVVSSVSALVPSQMDCGATDRIARETPVEPTRTVWDPALHSWEVSARCVHAGDCVPFLVRVAGSNSSPAVGSSAHERGRPSARYSTGAESVSGAAKPVVRPGQAVTLVWEQDGIRLVVPAVCMDAGAEGQRVRARIARGGRMLTAIVMSAGILRAAS